jgi:stearoyl-CoA desaturase (Delta-9 desaturase)
VSRAEKVTNLTAVLIPLVGFALAVALLWHRGIGSAELALFLGMYLVTGLGITVGYHRHLTHKAFQSPRPVRYGLAILGSMAVQGPVLDWVADHRKHHAFSDQEGDPHSPHHHDSGLRGLLHAHVGWLLETNGQASKRQFARDLLGDPGMRRINRLFPAWVLLGLAIPFGLGCAIRGTLAGGLAGLLWGGLVRIFMVHHVTWSVNSVCHYLGSRRWDTPDQSRNVGWLSLLSFGESWHHNHHAFPRSAYHGLRWYELDVSALAIRALAALGLARDVVRPDADAQQARLAHLTAHEAARSTLRPRSSAPGLRSARRTLDRHP